MSVSETAYSHEYIHNILKRAHCQGPELSVGEIEALLSIGHPDGLESLYAIADKVRKDTAGDGIHLRGLIEFSNYCRRNCLYCGLRRANRRLTRYRMDQTEVLGVVQAMAERGIKTVVLQSGEDPHFTQARMVSLVEKIKSRFDIAITLSVGIRSQKDLIAFRAAGADRYLLRHETANRQLYSQLHPDSRLGDRVEMLHALSELGYDIGTGPMVGLPGQTYRDLALDIDLARRLKADMFGVGPFIPHPDTPLSEAQEGTAEDTFKMIALARIVLREVHIPVTTALTTLDAEAREKGWNRGANVVMPNGTPAPYREQYELYKDKRCLQDSLKRCAVCLQMRVQSVSRHISSGYGDSLRSDRQRSS